MIAKLGYLSLFAIPVTFSVSIYLSTRKEMLIYTQVNQNRTEQVLTNTD